jgi:hypothetical protein
VVSRVNNNILEEKMSDQSACVQSEEKQEIKYFLQGCKLDSYFNVFIENGFDDLSQILYLSK